MLLDSNTYIKIKNNEGVSEKEFSDFLVNASDAYYTSEELLLEDSEFDKLKKIFISKYNYNPIQIGSTKALNKGFKKIKHNIPIGSLEEFDIDKNIEEEINKWFSKYASKDELLCVEDKADGLTVSISYTNGKLVQALTRGDGIQGEDITVNVRKMQGVPEILSIPLTCELKGEIVLTKKDHLEHLPHLKNTRNGAVGVTKRLDGEGCQYLTVYFYKLYCDDLKFKTETEMMNYLKNDLKLNTPRYYQIPLKLLIPLHTRYVLEVREKLLFDIDGLVVNFDNKELQNKISDDILYPEYARKYKFNAEEGKAEVLEVLHKIGRTGVLTPLALLSPTLLLGATVQRATLHNYDEIERLGLKIGDIVGIIRSKDVIPKITRVLKSNAGLPIETPKVCPECGTPIVKEEVRVFCPNEDCGARILKSLIHWLEVLKVKNAGIKLVEKLVNDEKLNSIADFYRLKQEDIACLDGQGEKNAKKILRELNEKRQLSVYELLAGLGIKNLGVKNAQILEDNFGTLDNILNISIESLVKLDGFQEKLASDIVSGLKQKEDLIKDLLNYIQIKKSAEGNLTGKSFCFSGFRDVTLEELIKKRGGKIANDVSKKLNYLVVQNKNGTTGKIAKAREYASLGVQIIDPSELEPMVKDLLF